MISLSQRYDTMIGLTSPLQDCLALHRICFWDCYLPIHKSSVGMDDMHQPVSISRQKESEFFGGNGNNAVPFHGITGTAETSKTKWND